MTDHPATPKPLKTITWASFEVLFSRFFKATENDLLVAKTTRDVNAVFSGGWDTVLTAEAQHAVNQKAEDSLANVRRMVATAKKEGALHTETGRKNRAPNRRAGDRAPNRRAGDTSTFRVTMAVIDEIPTGYSLLKLAQRHQPSGEWTLPVPARLWDRVLSDIVNRGCLDSPKSKAWRAEAKRTIGDWDKLTSSAAVLILDDFHSHLDQMLALRRTGKTTESSSFRALLASAL
ncbi:hypothetical protein JCM16303_003516 [Sporobolomyces ruberrimus]